MELREAWWNKQICFLNQVIGTFHDITIHSRHPLKPFSHFMHFIFPPVALLMEININGNVLRKHWWFHHSSILFFPPSLPSQPEGCWNRFKIWLVCCCFFLFWNKICFKQEIHLFFLLLVSSLFSLWLICLILSNIKRHIASGKVEKRVMPPAPIGDIQRILTLTSLPNSIESN